MEELFAMLDGDPSIEGVRNVISSWMNQTVVYNPSAWIDLCQKIMSRTTASQQATDAATKSRPVFDDEGESLSVGMTSDSTSGDQNRPTSRWRTQLFALQCLHDICITITRSGRREQLDIVYARSLGLPVSGLLVSRVPDLIKMAFTASTAYVTEIRLEGLIVLRDVIEVSESRTAATDTRLIFLTWTDLCSNTRSGLRECTASGATSGPDYSSPNSCFHIGYHTRAFSLGRGCLLCLCRMWYCEGRQSDGSDS